MRGMELWRKSDRVFSIMVGEERDYEKLLLFQIDLCQHDFYNIVKPAGNIVKEIIICKI